MGLKKRHFSGVRGVSVQAAVWWVVVRINSRRFGFGWPDVRVCVRQCFNSFLVILVFLFLSPDWKHSNTDNVLNFIQKMCFLNVTDIGSAQPNAFDLGFTYRCK